MAPIAGVVLSEEKEKKLVADAAKEGLVKRKGAGKEVISAEKAEELKMKEKRKREREHKRINRTAEF